MEQKNREYRNDEITVFWKPSKCIHATTCFRELIEVFNPRKKPWINMKGASTKKIIKVVDKCPTQAISWKYNKDIPESSRPHGTAEAGQEITPEDVLAMKESDPAKISILPNGPMLVEGSFRIISGEGTEMKSLIMTSFCRCGNSRSQPFCDGSHRITGFRDN